MGAKLVTTANRSGHSIGRILCLNGNGQRQVKGNSAMPSGLKDKGNAILSCNFLAGAEWSAGIWHFKDRKSGIVIPVVSTFHSLLVSFLSCPIDRSAVPDCEAREAREPRLATI